MVVEKSYLNNELIEKYLLTDIAIDTLPKLINESPKKISFKGKKIKTSTLEDKLMSLKDYIDNSLENKTEISPFDLKYGKLPLVYFDKTCLAFFLGLGFNSTGFLIISGFTSGLLSNIYLGAGLLSGIISLNSFKKARNQVKYYDFNKPYAHSEIPLINLSKKEISEKSQVSFVHEYSHHIFINSKYKSLNLKKEICFAEGFAIGFTKKLMKEYSRITGNPRYYEFAREEDFNNFSKVYRNQKRYLKLLNKNKKMKNFIGLDFHAHGNAFFSIMDYHLGTDFYHQILDYDFSCLNLFK